MSFSLSSIPSAIRDDARKLCEYLRDSALHGAVGWSIDPEACFAAYGFVWAAERRYASIALAIDERRGKVYRVEIQLPIEVA